MASECARADIAEQRHLWITRCQPLMRLEPHRLVFIDETAILFDRVLINGGQRGLLLELTPDEAARACAATWADLTA